MTKDEACAFEIALIKELNSTDYNYGYNLTIGGEGTVFPTNRKHPNSGRQWTEEQKAQHRERLKNVDRSYMRTEEYRKKHSEASKKMWANEEFRLKQNENHFKYVRRGENHPFYGKTGSQSYTAKSVICLNTNEVFGSAVEASQATGANYSKLCMCCRGERKSSGKDSDGNPLKWMFYRDYLKQNNLTDEEAHKSLFFIA